MSGSWLRRKIGSACGISRNGAGAALAAFCLLAAAAGPAEAVPPTLELVGQWGGEAQAVVISGTTAYLGVGPSIHVFDVTTPGSPVRIGQALIPGIVTGLAVQGDYVYASMGEAGFQIVNVATPSAPVVAGFYDTAGTANDVAVSGAYAYIADNDQGLVILNVSDKGAPTLSGSLDTPGQAYGVAVSGTYAYVADLYTLRIVDVTDASAPSEIWGGSFNSGEYFSGIAVSGTYVYLAASDCGLHPIDVTDPASPVSRDFKSIYNGSVWYANRVTVVGNRAYVGMSSQAGGQLAVFDITDPTVLSVLGTAATVTDNYSGGVLGVAVTGNHAYAVDPMNGLHVFNVSDPASMTEVATHFTASYVSDVATDGTHAYLATSNAYLAAIGFSGDTPSLAGKVLTPADHDIFFVVASGTHLYTSERTSGLGIYDISDPASMSRTGGSAVYGNMPMGLFVRDDYAYVGSYDYGFNVFSVSDPAAPINVSRIMGFERAEDVVVQGNYAYIPGGSLGLRVVDITDPAAPFVVRTVNIFGWAYGLAISGNHVYIGDNNGKFVIVDITDPTAAYVTGSCSTLDYAKDVLVLDSSHALVTDGYKGVALVDITDPAAPTRIASYETPGYAKNFARLGDRILVADGEGGLAVFALQMPVAAHASDDLATTGENHAVTIDVLANDTGEGVLAVTAVDDPAHGTAVIVGTSVQYTPDSGWSGDDAFTYTMQDAGAGTDTATITVTVTLMPTLTATSGAALDGWVLERTETSGSGGTLNASGTIRVGDDAVDRQYRGVLSFDTAGLPDNAVIVSATLRVKKQGILGVNPFGTHGALYADVIRGAFSGKMPLQAADFRAPATATAAVKILNKPAGAWFAAPLGAKALAAVNRTGLTQLRLRFARDDNDDGGADYLSFYSGNAAVSSRPQLVIRYEVP